MVDGKNAPQVETAWQHTDGTITRMWWSTSDKAWEYTLPKLKAIGVFDLETPTITVPNHNIEAKMDSYGGTPKLKWDMGRMATPAAPDAIALLNAKLKAALGPTISKVPVSPKQPVKAPPAAPAASPPPPPADDEEEMFAKSAPLATKETAWAEAKGDMAKWTAAVKETATKYKLKEKDFTVTQWSEVKTSLELPF
jgi:hypothetical protein